MCLFSIVFLYSSYLYEFITSAQGSFPEITFLWFFKCFFMAWSYGFFMVVKKAKIGFMIFLCFFFFFFLCFFFNGLRTTKFTK